MALGHSETTQKVSGFFLGIEQHFRTLRALLRSARTGARHAENTARASRNPRSRIAVRVRCVRPPRCAGGVRGMRAPKARGRSGRTYKKKRKERPPPRDSSMAGRTSSPVLAGAFQFGTVRAASANEGGKTTIKTTTRARASAPRAPARSGHPPGHPRAALAPGGRLPTAPGAHWWCVRGHHLASQKVICLKRHGFF